LNKAIDGDKNYGSLLQMKMVAGESRSGQK